MKKRRLMHNIARKIPRKRTSLRAFLSLRFFVLALACASFLCTGIPFLYAQAAQKMKSSPAPEIPESASCRKELIETWFMQDPEILRAAEPQLMQNRVGDYFLVRQEEENGQMRIIVAPLVRQKVLMAVNNLEVPSENRAAPSAESAADLQTGVQPVTVIPSNADKASAPAAVSEKSAEKKNAAAADLQAGVQPVTVIPSNASAPSDPAVLPSESENTAKEIWIETWPETAPGSWVLYRDALTGKPLRIRYYIVPDGEVYADFFPGKEKCLADFVVFGAVAAGGVPVPVGFDRFYTATLEELSRLTRYTLPWNYTKVFSHSYDGVKQMIGLVRFLLPSLHKSGKISGEGASLNFVKWIVDGLVKPLTGGTVRLEEEQTDAKSLENIRTLAAAAISARTDIVYDRNTSGADVKTDAFAYYIDADGVPKNTGYAFNSGYPVELLKPLFYVLAVTEADRFFLGAVRQGTVQTSAGTAERQVFTGTAAFFPWFDSQGRFRLSVFEKGEEYTIDEFAKKYRGGFVSLVRIKASRDFFPDRFED